MGLLSRLFGGHRAAFEGRFWRTSERKIADLLEQVRADADAGPCLVVHHFASTGERLEAELEARRLGYRRLSRPATDELANLATRVRGPTVALLASDELPPGIVRGVERGLGSRDHPPCRVHLAEHFPTSARDQHVLNLEGLLPGGSRFLCYVGLDELWLGRSLGSRALELLDRMGAPDDEPLVHPMLPKAIRRVQAGIEAKQRGAERSAHSCEEWMQLNLDG